MACRSLISKLPHLRSMEGSSRVPRYFSDGKGRLLSEEERAAEKVYIQKMESERLEKMKKKMEQEKEKEKDDKKQADEGHKA
ncbi:uncharacterized protein LOC105421491 isoform X1 [Amborella trichopoda]|uniref:uncharacterized protein LOC105421491 isoform X1 n=1 Tax=Amborella trichopoda TaxID=13333 RepID=UPI0005D3B5BA|nr:uncharacterized protein LOC105421491 isoform X1 [Amborella trichopoda]|eukprot:XP_011627301.1 uncharacterized protein LOC105421491 isoform X1 [Amborella trichopoda]